MRSVITIGLLAAAAAAQPPARLALKGLDPLALASGEEVAGNATLEERYGRFVYRFASAENRKQFLAAPHRWAIQWGGACARMGPLSGRGSPDRWAVHDGRIFIFASEGCRDGFLNAPARYVEPPPKLPEASEQARRDGRAWIDRAVAVHGGAAVLDTKRALRLAVKSTRGGWTTERELVVSARGACRHHSRWSQSEPGATAHETLWVAGAEGFVREDGTVFDGLSAAERCDVLRHAHRQPIALLWARTRADFVAIDRGQGKLGDAEVADVLVHVDGLSTTLHLDPKSGRVLGISWRGRAGSGVTSDVTETFREWQTVDGVLLPARRDVVVDGKPSESLSAPWDTVELLASAPAGAFARHDRR